MSEPIPVEPIEITVKGTINSGKSTVSHLIAEMLLRAGFQVSIKDEPLAEGWHARVQDRVDYLQKRGLKIHVVTEQRPRNKNG